MTKRLMNAMSEWITKRGLLARLGEVELGRHWACLEVGDCLMGYRDYWEASKVCFPFLDRKKSTPSLHRTKRMHLWPVCT